MTITMGYETGFARDTLNDMLQMLTEHERQCALDDIQMHRNHLNYKALLVVQMVVIRKKNDWISREPQHSSWSSSSDDKKPSEFVAGGSLSEPYDFCMALTRVSFKLNRPEFMGVP